MFGKRQDFGGKKKKNIAAKKGYRCRGKNIGASEKLHKEPAQAVVGDSGI